MNPARAAKRIVAQALRDRTYTVRRGPAKGLRRKGGFGWVPEVLWRSTQEHRFLRSLRLEGLTVYDVGAFEGAVTLFLSRAVGDSGHVVAFEPNPTNAARLRENVAINRLENVEIRQVAIGKEAGTATLAFTPREGGCGTLTPADDRQRAIDVSVETLDRLVGDGLPPPSFMKIDVEGLECDLLEGARATLVEHAPRLMIELHGYELADRRANAERVLGILSAFGYSIGHVETAQRVTAANVDVALEGHLACNPPSHPSRAM